MKRINLKNDIVIFQFPPDEGRFLGVNITAVFDGKEYLLIDAGYEHHMKQLLEVLDADKCKHVICTHFHPDHLYGVSLLGKKHIIGSKFSIDTLTMFEDQDNDLFIPSTFVDEDYSFDFGRHKINISLNKGHSNCGTIITLNGKYIFTGDDLMYTNEGESVIPFLAAKDPVQQRNALNRIKKEALDMIVIPSHGKVIDDYNNLCKDIDNKLIYLDYALKKKKYHEFTEETKLSFIGKAWHTYNISD